MKITNRVIRAGRGRGADGIWSREETAGWEAWALQELKRCQQRGLEREQQADEAQLMQDERLL